MADRPTVDYQSAENLLLFRLQFALARRESLTNSLGALSRLLNLPFPLVKICADRLEGNGFCTIRTVEHVDEHPVTGNPTTYEEEHLDITELGVNQVQSWPSEKYQQVARPSDLTLSEWDFKEASDALIGASGESFTLGVSSLGGDHTQAPDNDDDDADITVPASDRVVTLDHNSEEYKETVEAVDDVIESVRGDNEYGDRDPEDKEQRLAELTAGKQLLQSVRVSAKSVEIVLIKTLLYLAGIGVAVSEITDAIAKVKALLGL